ncbi:outer membrane protein/peptidoglycan-associated (lipo)protein [Aequorivita sublithincola DSM 14238]|uniref:Outer membrane protein/peptidoglycan-associated (Lipo)protein n=2 Tax=Aequorivita TaxID=153265 RepID=I3YW07_AEQSU|nr:outer membrane protein/peptidoglycan-associated (lipo)protein [Aequorivita sublithincola DSM 14238]
MICATLLGTTMMNAQFGKRLGKIAERAAERTVENRVDREASKSTDRALDTLIDGPKKSKKEQRRESKNKQKNGGNVIGGNSDTDNSSSTTITSQNSSSLEEMGENEVGFKRGNRIIFSDNFERDALGDFPANWNTNMGGEVKKLKGFNSKYLKVPAKSTVSVQLKKKLPKNFTVEFEIILPSDALIRHAGVGLGREPKNIDYLTSGFNNFDFDIYSSSEKQYAHNSDRFRYAANKLGANKISTNYEAPLNTPIKVAMEVQGRRIRIYLEGKKVVDLPTIFEDEYRNALYFTAITSGRIETQANYFYLSNVTIAETTTDERSQVLKELNEKGRFSTNAILFNTGSAYIKSGSEAILKEVGEVMQSVPDMRIMIVGHTDGDGDSNSNLKLSDERAKSVRAALVSQYGISIGRIQTDGKGETNPVADNSSENGKSQNRRVEFIKL